MAKASKARPQPKGTNTRADTPGGESAHASRFPAWVPYAIVAALSIGYPVLMMIVGGASLSVPFDYSGDAALFCMIAKGVATHASTLVNGDLGLPGYGGLRDFAQPDQLTWVFVGLLSLVSGDWARGMNLYFILGFAMTSLTMLWAMRRLGVSALAAVPIAILYAFLPFRFLRGEGHLVLLYWAVPLAMLTVMRVASSRPPFVDPETDRFVFDLRKPATWQSLLFAVVISFTSVYFAVATAILLVFAGVKSAVTARSWRRLLPAALLLAVVVACVLIAMTPGFLNTAENGPNPAVGSRTPIQAEIYGLRLTQLVFPTPGHRIASLSAFRDEYARQLEFEGTWLNNEANSASLGLIGTIGLILSMACFFLGVRWQKGSVTEMGRFATFMLLVTTVGGIGALIAYVAPQIRAYNRLSVVIAFFALGAVAFALDAFLNDAKNAKSRLVRGLIVAALLVSIGLADQTPAGVADAWAAGKEQYRADDRFVAQVEKALPEEASVLQLPYMPFPEPGGPIVKMTDYAPVIPYLHSETLKWSYGAPKGRETDMWQQQVAMLRGASLVAAAKDKGFSAIWIDGFGYEDGGAEVLGSLSGLTSGEPLRSPDGRYMVVVLK